MMRATVAATVVAAAVGSCATPREPVDPLGGRPDAAGAWQRLPDAPLSPRVSAVVVGVDQRMLVVGGWEFLCPPSADCNTPEAPLLDDGAVYDLATDSWSAITPPPFGVRRADYATSALDGSAYMVTGCANGPMCGAQPRLLSYDLAGDRWTDHGAVPGPKHQRHLTTIGRTLLAYAGSDEGGEVPDLVFDPESGTWAELPDDPMPRTYDRFIVPVEDQLVLTGSSRAELDSGDVSTKLAARFELASNEWTALPDAPGNGYQLFPTDRGPLLNGHFLDSSGWILDPDAWTWSALADSTGEGNDLGGVLDRDRATYDMSSVWQAAASMRLFVYDTASAKFVTIPAVPRREDVYGESSSALGRDLFVFGGQRWPSDGLNGELVGDAWLWTAPVD